jgi:two-component system NtrC family sensor kinase
LNKVKGKTSILSAMKTFSHPSGDEAELCGLNKAIYSTVTVAHNEWKYIVYLEFSLSQELTVVPCFLDNFYQIFLILLINAAYAIEAQLEITGEAKGKIVITTRRTEKHAEITISDSGTGMSDEIRRKVFDPFFTTKPVNKGTGQGLAIANDIIVNKHNGSIKIKTEQRKGTTFVLRLPYQS